MGRFCAMRTLKEVKVMFRNFFAISFVLVALFSCTAPALSAKKKSPAPAPVEAHVVTREEVENRAVLNKIWCFGEDIPEISNQWEISTCGKLDQETLFIIYHQSFLFVEEGKKYYDGCDELGCYHIDHIMIGEKGSMREIKREPPSTVEEIKKAKGNAIKTEMGTFFFPKSKNPHECYLDGKQVFYCDRNPWYPSHVF
jgi:hypothetical protein